MDAFDNFVALSGIYLPDAITTLEHGMRAETVDDARDRAKEACAILECLLALSRTAAAELRMSEPLTGQLQEAEAVLRCMRKAVASA
jgi:hypothetical protein